MKSLIFLLLLSLNYSAEIISTHPNGKKIVLLDNFTWRYLGETKSMQNPAKGSSQAVYKSITFEDFQLDFDALKGQKIRIDGYGMYMSGIFQISPGGTNMTSLIVSINNISRDSKKLIIQKCADLMNRCRVSVFGKVEQVNMFQKGIIADNITKAN